MTAGAINFNDPFVLAFAGGIAIALVSSVLSVFVVLRRMAFVGEGIAHSAFGGAGVALLMGLFLSDFQPALARDGIIAAFCIAAAITIGTLSRRGKLSEDTSIGIILVTSMAIGVVLRDIRQHLVDIGFVANGSYAPSFEALLFGQIFAMNQTDVILAWILAAVSILLIALTFKELTFFAFDEETATVFGVRTGLFYYGLLILLGLAVVLAMRSLGIILVGAVLILPGAAAKMISQRIGRLTVLSAAFGIVGMTVGLLLSLWLDFLSAGPVVALTYCTIFAVCYTISKTKSN